MLLHNSNINVAIAVIIRVSRTFRSQDSIMQLCAQCDKTSNFACVCHKIFSRLKVGLFESSLDCIEQLPT